MPGEPVRDSASFENTRSDFVSQSMAVPRVSEPGGGPGTSKLRVA
ncbi:hypothetical protein IWQ53_002303 [Labrenzia sp. EL_162]|nr:hypothetical protein [Labrenzia sp. EL_162]